MSVNAKWPLTARFLYTVLLRAVKGHFWAFLISNIIGYLSFCRMDAACQRNVNPNTLNILLRSISPSGIGPCVLVLFIFWLRHRPPRYRIIRSQRGGSDVHWYHPFCDLKISNLREQFKSNSVWITARFIVQMHRKYEQLFDTVDISHKWPYN